MEVVEGSGCRPWVRLTADNMAEFEDKIQRAKKPRQC
jgi:hypothetical protein